MKVIVAWVIAFGLMASPLMADVGKAADGADTSSAAKSPDAPVAGGTPVTNPAADARPDTAAKPAAKSVEVEIEQLRDLLEAQAKQFQTENEQLRMQLKEQQQKLLEFEERWKAANPASASSKPAEMVNNAAGMNSTVASSNATLADFKTSNEIIKTTAGADQGDAKKSSEDGPSSIRFKGITITPGGIIMAETAFRTHATGDDIQTQFTGIPYPNSALSKVTENSFSARQTRLTLRADTDVLNMKLTAYYETDFNGTGVTSNNRQSNSYVLRMRQLWARAAWENGFSITGGQQWSLVTENKKGVENLGEQFPLQIDPQYLVGWAWQRAYAFRVAKSFGDKFAVAADIEGPQTTFGGRGSNNNFFFNIPGVGGGLFNFVDTTGYTANKSPDFLFKAALDPGWGHYEVVGIVSPFRDRVYPCGAQPLLTTATGLDAACLGSNTSVAGAFNDSRVGGGFGATARLPVVAKKVDLMAHFQGGDGIGRYSSAQLADVTARPDGTLAPIRSAAWLAELELHPNPKLDLYAYYGGEYDARTAFTFLNPANAHLVGVGYGSPLFNNSACTTEGFPTTGATNVSPTAPGTGPGTCNGDVHTVVEGTLGFWHNIYSGNKGRFRWGIQYSYLTKLAWSGNATTNVAIPATVVSQRPKAIDNMVFTSFRYYLP